MLRIEECSVLPFIVHIWIPKRKGKTSDRVRGQILQFLVQTNFDIMLLIKNYEFGSF